jgi:uncharacterized protein (TIGR03437 family)
LPPGSINTPYLHTYTATGGFPPYTFNLSQGTFPDGLALDGAGRVTGTPRQAGQFNVTAVVTDSRGNTARQQCDLLISGTLTVWPPRLDFLAVPGKPPTPALISVACPNTVTPCSIQASVQGLRNLQLTSTAPATPALVRVTPDTSTGPFQPQQGSIVFTSPQTGGVPISIPVTVNFNTNLPSRSSIAPREFLLDAPLGATQPIRRAIEVASTGSDTFDVSVRSTSPFIRIPSQTATATASSPAVIPIEILPLGLTSGIHQGFIDVSTPSQTLRVPVKLAINASRDSIVPTPEGLTLEAVEGGPSPRPVAVNVLSAQGDQFVQGSPSTISGGPWLEISPGSNAARINDPARFVVSANSRNLTAGPYFGDVTFSSPTANNSPRAAAANLRVLPLDTVLIKTEPSALLFTVLDSQVTLRETLRVYNQSAGPVTITAQITGDPRVFALSTDPPGQTPAGQFRSFQIAVTPRGLGAGVFKTAVAVYANGLRDILLTDVAVVVPSRIGVSTAKLGARELAGCTPSRLIPLATGIPVNFTAPGGLPLQLETRVVDDCGDPMTAGSVLATFSNNNPPAALSHVGAGAWTGTWQVQSSSFAPASITFRASDPSRNLQGTLEVLGAVTANEGIPEIPAGAILSTASFSTSNALAPGSLAAIFGSNLATGTSAPSSLPLPTQLGTTRVFISGRQMPLFFAGALPSFSQINGMLPYDLAPNTLHQASVRNGNLRSNFAGVILDEIQPSVFTTTQSGSGQGVIVDGANPTRVVDQFNPTSSGRVIIIYGEGLAAVNPPAIAGQAVPASPLSQVTAPVSVTIGGVQAEVLFAGLTPFFTGLYQLNVLVPSGIAPGDAVPVIVTAGGRTSPPVTISVR